MRIEGALTPDNQSAMKTIFVGISLIYGSLSSPLPVRQNSALANTNLVDILSNAAHDLYIGKDRSDAIQDLVLQLEQTGSIAIQDSAQSALSAFEDIVSKST
jgi:hypothetical protein